MEKYKLVKIYANECVTQVAFIESGDPCEMSYGDHGGKYLRQRGVTLLPLKG
jgi:deoxycytidine triphosphate deaminase